MTIADEIRADPLGENAAEATVEQGGLILEAETDPETGARSTMIAMRLADGGMLKMYFPLFEAMRVQRKLREIIAWQAKEAPL